MRNPPDPNQDRQPNSDHTRVVHRVRGRGQAVRETVNHERNHDIKTGNRINSRSKFTQPERAGLDVLAASQEVRKDRQQIRQRGHQDKRADEGIEGRQ